MSLFRKHAIPLVVMTYLLVVSTPVSAVSGVSCEHPARVYLKNLH